LLLEPRDGLVHLAEESLVTPGPLFPNAHGHESSPRPSARVSESPEGGTRLP
jgi:hypothetical protein